VTSFYQLYIRSRRRARALRFHVAHLGNHVAWAPFTGIEDLGAEGQGTLLFERNFGLPQYTSKRKRPTLGS
jgi:hypothetical protein